MAAFKGGVNDDGSISAGREWIRRVHLIRTADRRNLTDIYVDSLSGLDRYEIPAVVIDDEVHPEAVARIFERVNRLGRPLATFDLMVAKSFAENLNLRDEWDLVQEREEQLVDYLPDGGLSILNVIALQVRNSVR
ncbi:MULTISPECIES: hypothetical protein [Microbacterium]|uniref:hypothetical protein n=1 Tax=Microbacterium TaxID=33882 RepID=UPI000468836D|nr:MULTISPECIES: hypothetical protein [Microbacterium]MCZ0710779.1 hypothetical protein [Microbacterium paraoxydans]MDH5131634.1 hypothetical protein [Microbacterium sp. RD10]MDH5135087.1 hypothetical protein [Microbacterium sp. RD11]MDH5144451.1 hypothetical protein [Microbacterium sp. RD12]MDH5153395.1 hypothetical protein [Microbacterium sp. RD06]